MIESYYIIISKSVDDNDRSWKGTMTKPNYGTADLGFIPDTHGAELLEPLLKSAISRFIFC